MMKFSAHAAGSGGCMATTTTPMFDCHAGLKDWEAWLSHKLSCGWQSFVG
jgi:hypothetical protein